MSYSFHLDHVCAKTGARAATIQTTHGTIRTPIFMPVGTQATVKGVLPRDLRELGAQVVLANTYHLMLRPGSERIRDAGGLHKFMAWERPLLTDSGGFQVFSLATLRKVTDAGCTFQSHVDGSRHVLDPERAMQLQEDFGSDIMMALDVCPPAGCDAKTLHEAMRRTTSWLSRCLAARKRRDDCALYGIVQGGVERAARKQHVEQICGLDCEGYSIGGLSVGEAQGAMYEACAFTAGQMPQDKARYLMGVGTPEDLVRCIGFGVDQFDCVLPSRNARHGVVFTREGKLQIKNRRFFADDRPLDPDCVCMVCRQFTRSYVRHLFVAGELLAATLVTVHNLAFFLRLVQEARDAILQDGYDGWSGATLARLGSGRWTSGAKEQDDA